MERQEVVHSVGMKVSSKEGVKVKEDLFGEQSREEQWELL